MTRRRQSNLLVPALERMVEAFQAVQLVIDDILPPEGRDEVNWTVHHAWFDEQGRLNAFLIPPSAHLALYTPEQLLDIKVTLGAEWLGVTIHEDRQVALRVSWPKDAP